MWLKNFILGLKIVDSITKPITLYCDNQAAVFFSSNNKVSGAAKHIDIKYHFIREKVEQKEIQVNIVRSGENVADVLTKPLARKNFEKMREMLGVHPPLLD